eukprot:scaffold19570_cov33-Phaeocystis_antarctica.AAC.2
MESTTSWQAQQQRALRTLGCSPVRDDDSCVMRPPCANAPPRPTGFAKDEGSRRVVRRGGGNTTC